MNKFLNLLVLALLIFSCRKPLEMESLDESLQKPKHNLPEFNKLYGGSSEDYVKAVIPANGSGYLFTGETYSSDGDVASSIGGGDVWIVKVDDSGNKLWQKTYGGSNYERSNSLALCEAGYLVAGLTFSTDGDAPATHGVGDGFVLKVDEAGNLIDQKTFGGSDHDEIVKIIPDGNGNYILVGLTYSTNEDLNTSHGGGDLWVIKINAQLDIMWQKTLGGSSSDAAISAVVSKDGGYLITGSTSSNDGDVKYNHGGADFWVVKLSTNGKLVWEKTYGGTGFDLPNTITSSVDGGALITGLTTSFDGDVTVRKGGFVDGWMIKIDRDGDVKWDKTVGGTGFEQCLFSIPTHNGDFLIGGSTTSNDGDFTGNHGEVDGWVMRLDKQGKEKWTKVTGGSAWDFLYSACAGTDGNYIIAGTSDSNDGDVSGNHGSTDTWLFTLKDK